MSGALTHRHSFQTCGNPDQVAAILGQVGRQPQRVSKTMSRNGRIRVAIENGFGFRYPDLKTCLHQILKTSGCSTPP